MASNVVLASNFNAKKLSFSQLRSLDSGGKQAYTNYDGGMFVLQAPTCSLPYGMSAFDKAGPVKYDVQLSLRGYDEEGSKMNQFFKAMEALDEFMIDQGVKNSKAWFKADLSREVIKAFYTPLIRYSKDKDGNVKPYPPTVKCSLKKKRDSDAFDVECYDSNRTLYKGIPLEELLVKGAELIPMMQCTGMWIAGSKYGLSFKLLQSVISKLPQSSRSFTFVDDGELSAPAPSQRAPAPAPAVVEDEEEDEQEEEEDDVFQPPQPVKKSVVSAVLPPKAAPTPSVTLDDAADDAEPVPVPKKATTLVKKTKVVSKAK